MAYDINTRFSHTMNAFNGGRISFTDLANVLDDEGDIQISQIGQRDGYLALHCNRPHPTPSYQFEMQYFTVVTEIKMSSLPNL